MSDKPAISEQDLRQALVRFLGERSNKNLFAFFDLLRQARVFAPAQIEGLPQPDLSQLTPGSQVQVQGNLRIKNSCLVIQGKKYLPLFTCREQLEKGPKSNCLAVPLAHFAKVAEADREIEALVVDAFSQPNLIIPRDKLADLISGNYRHEVQEVKLSATAQVTPPQPFPENLAGSLFVLLDNLAGVRQAWLLQINDQGRDSWLVVADFQDISRQTLAAMLGSAAKKHGQGRPLALLPYDQPRARELVQGVDPFYQEGSPATPANMLN